MASAVYISNDNLLEIANLRVASTGAFANSATVTVTVKDAAGSEVSGQTWPTTMDYVASSNGIYRAVLQDTMSLTESAKYTAEITATSSGSIKGFWSLPLTALKRRM